MIINNRNEDLSKVFDKNWRVNHSNFVQEKKEKEKDMMNKLYDKREFKNPSSDDLSNLNHRMSILNNAKRTSLTSNIVKKWK